nr:endonuclease NucS [Candidatus Freyarchaeota archaeon]
MKETDLRKFILGHLDRIDEGLDLVQSNEHYIDNQLIDLYCSRRDGKKVFIELEWESVNQGSRRQALDQKSLLDSKFPSGSFEHIFFVPAIEQKDKSRLEEMGITVKSFSKPEMEKEISIFYDSQSLLKKILSKIDEKVDINVLGRTYLLDMISACYTPYSLPDYDPSNPKFRGKGLHRYEAGTQLEIIKCLASGKFYGLSPELVAKLILDIFEMPFAQEKRESTGEKRPKQWYCSSFIDYIKTIPVRQVGNKIAEIYEMTKSFLGSCNVKGDILTKESSKLNRKLLPKFGVILPTDMMNEVISRFELKSNYKDVGGRDYTYSMARRIIELMVLKKLYIANLGTEGTMPLIRPLGQEFEPGMAISLRPRE